MEAVQNEVPTITPREALLLTIVEKAIAATRQGSGTIAALERAGIKRDEMIGVLGARRRANEIIDIVKVLGEFSKAGEAKLAAMLDNRFKKFTPPVTA